MLSFLINFNFDVIYNKETNEKLLPSVARLQWSLEELEHLVLPGFCHVCLGKVNLQRLCLYLCFSCSYEGPELEMWSLGVLLFTLLFSENPFCDVEEILDAKLKLPFSVSSGMLAFCAAGF